MSKAILIVICDFLLLSLLALARFDSQDPLQQQVEPGTVTEQTNPEEDLAAVLKQSLEEERLAREELNRQLHEAEDALRRQENLLATRDEQMEEARSELLRKQQELGTLDRVREELERRLADSRTNVLAMELRYLAAQSNLVLVQRKELATRRDLSVLEEQYEASRTNVTHLEEKLAAALSDAKVSQQVVEVLQQDLQRQVRATGQLQDRVQDLERTRQAIEGEKVVLASQLQVVEAEKKLSQEQLNSMRTEVEAVREEKTQLEQQTTRLAADVSTLAATSEKLTEKIIQDQPQSANAIFAQFSTNLIRTSFQAKRSGIFGQTVKKETEAKTVLVSRGEAIYAIHHIEETPLVLEPYPSEWENITGTIGRGPTIYSITQLSFLDQDPRILLVPVGAPQAKALGCRIYPLAEDASRFQEAVLIGATEGYYGECQFQIDPATPHYVRMQRERFSFFSGKFNPSRGDLVLSKTGEVLGVMANKEYCLVLQKFNAARQLRAGPALREPALLLTQMYQQLMRLPYRLQ